MNIPAVADCLTLMDRYGMLDHIREHSFIVARVAETIAAELKVPGGRCAPDFDLVRAGALLHDIAKTKCLDGSCQHAEEGRAICLEHGFPEVGRIVGSHVILSSFTPDRYRLGEFPAAEIVYYADKRVRHTEIVSLDARLEYIIAHYAGGSDRITARIKENFSRCTELESWLFSFLPFTSAELPERIDRKPFRP